MQTHPRHRDELRLPDTVINLPVPRFTVTRAAEELLEN